MVSPQVERGLGQLSALADPLRRALYVFVSRQPGAVSRDEAAAGVGVARHVAKFNLDRLEEEGLLASEFSRPPGRTGPGAGRPAKRYRKAVQEIEISLPERRYAFAGQIMAGAISAAQRSGSSIGDALSTVAREAGRGLGLRVRDLAKRGGRRKVLGAITTVLEEQGYEPHLDDDTVTLANCPFHSLADEHRDLVCGMNLTLLEGMVEAADVPHVTARLRPAEGRCCVQLCAAPSA